MYSATEAWGKKRHSTRPEPTVVIPALNKTARIVPTIDAVVSPICGRRLDRELIVAEDGSKDHTVALSEGFGRANPRALQASANGGKGSIVRRGVTAGRDCYLLNGEAHDSNRIEGIRKLLPTPHYCVRVAEIPVARVDVPGPELGAGNWRKTVVLPRIGDLPGQVSEEGFSGEFFRSEWRREPARRHRPAAGRRTLSSRDGTTKLSGCLWFAGLQSSRLLHSAYADTLEKERLAS